jgi:hypothetical protein
MVNSDTERPFEEIAMRTRNRVHPVRLTTAERDGWRRAAQQRGWTVSQLVREAVRVYINHP